jgi:hypothetical protein
VLGCLLAGLEGHGQSLTGTQAGQCPAGYRSIAFEVRTAPGKLGGETGDPITIVFSNVSGLARTPPRPVLGDALQEFSFSGRDLAGTLPFRFDRCVKDLSFLEARYVRVVNQGSDGWAGDYLSLSVDGRPVLSRQSLFPRQGRQKEGGIEKFNRTQWLDRNFWEGELQRIRVDRLSKK